MGSFGGEAVGKKKAMWLYPKVMSFSPSERWGHSACCLDGVVYVFGGCCGGLHFSDVLALDLETMKWSSVATTGQQPGTRDSHSTVLVGHKMIVLGGTNGSKKVNDIHILDLRTKEWSRPHCVGNPPSPRESHTATVIGNDRLVIFGGSGEGGANYLNDVHILDLKTMSWCSPEVKGDLPAPRDSHTAVAVGNQLLVYGGDCGDRYYGEVDVLDMDTLTWSRLAVQGATPGVRAGHATINIGTKIYIIGGVGDKHYYSDVWVLDLSTCSWNQLDICGQRPQGRFSHSAVVTDTDIAIYGGCGEDERPLNELLILQLGSEHPNGRYNVSMCKVFGNHWSQYKHKFIKNSKNLPKRTESDQRDRELETGPKQSLLRGLDDLHTKRRKTGDAKSLEIESEQEEHSLSLSQNSSPSQSDQEQNNIQKMTKVAPNSFSTSRNSGLFKLHHHHTPKCDQKSGNERNCDSHSTPHESPRKLKTEQFLRRQEVQFLAVDQKPQNNRPALAPLIGAEVHGTVDGAFDSGYLMTATVNGQILRGVLFPPGPGFIVPSRPAVLPRNPSGPVVVAQPQISSPSHVIPAHARPPHQPTPFVLPESAHITRHSHPASASGNKLRPSRLNSDLQGVVLTLGGPGGGSC